MKAAQLVAHGAPGRVEIRDVPDPTPGPGEVVVRVRQCGVNRLDLWLEEGALPIPIELPRTPGSEIAGDVHAVGEGVQDFREGQRVAVQSNLFCGTCEFCARGEESLCLNAQLLGVQADGGFAELARVPATALVSLPAEVSYETSAALTLAGSTAMHMLIDRATVRPGDWVLVMGGASGVGSAAIQIARGLGAHVITTASNAAKRALALELGAEGVVDSSLPTWPAEVRKLSGRRGVDLVVEHVGGRVLEQAFHCLARGGTVVTCGATAGRQPTLDLWPFFVKQQRLVGSYGRTRRDMRATLDWAASGRLKPVVDRVFPLAETAAALGALRRREVLGKVLVACASVLLMALPRVHSQPCFEDRPVDHDVHEARPLPHSRANDVRRLALGSDGRVWAATAGGVFVTTDQPAPWVDLEPSALDGPAFDIAADVEGGIWVGSWNGLHHLIDGKATRVAGVEGPIAAVSAATNLVLAAGPEGSYLARDGQWERIETGASRYLHRVAIEPGGACWFATGMGLYRWTPGGGAYFRVPFDRVSADVRDWAAEDDGGVVAGTLGGLERFRKGRWHRSDEASDGLPSADVRCVARGADGRLWVGTARGLARQEDSGWAVRMGRRWLLDDDVRDVLVGTNGSAWVATAGGVSVLRRHQISLAEKARRFHDVLEARHVRPPGLVEKCRLSKPGDVSSWTPMDDDNDGGYTAVYLAMESYRYAVTGDPKALAGARRALASLELLQRVTGTPGFVARSVVPSDWTQMHDPNVAWSEAEWAAARIGDPRAKRVPERWRRSSDGHWLWKGDTSSDEITAHFFGYYVFHELAADASDRARIRDQVCRITDHLVDHGFTLTDLDGQPTRWGVWAPERLNEDPDWAMERGINSVEMLSFLKLASHVSGRAEYDARYRDLIERHHYDRNVEEAPNLNPAWRTHIDAELLAFAYPALLALETDPRLRKLYRASFERWHEAVRADRTAFFELLYAAHAQPRREDLGNAVTTLRDTPLDLVRWTVDNAAREDVRLRRFPQVEAWQTDRVLPAAELGYSRTDQNPWLARQGDDGNSESDGVFWLLPYWMARHAGILRGP